MLPRFDVWEAQKRYFFAPEGIKLRIYVQAASKEIRMTPEEAIAIATSLANEHLNQFDEEN